MTQSLKDLYEKYAIRLAYDIVEHLPTLHSYGKECKHITELGTRLGYSTSAFLYSLPTKMICYDVDEKKEFIDKARNISVENNIEFIFNNKDVLSVEIEETDLLFIDTLHTYAQLKKELELHAKKARKYIIMHDTEIFKDIGEDRSKPGLAQAINEFLQNNLNWQIDKIYTNNFGLTILKNTNGNISNSDML